MTYKVGDKVRIVRKRPQRCWNHYMDKYLGKTMTIRECYLTSYRMKEDYGEYAGYGWFWYEDMIAGLAEPEREPCTVELRFDGMITTATLKRGGRDVKTAEARCNPKDTYSRAEGARVAVERLFEKKRKEGKAKESKLEHGNPKVGDKFVIVGDFTGHGFPIGEIVTLYHFHKDFSLYMNRYGRKRWVYEVDMKPYKENFK